MRVLFAMYLCLLTVYPCNDPDTCDDAETAVALNNSSSHDDVGNNEELCSPLCICSCCATSFQMVYSLEVGLPLPRYQMASPTFYRENSVADNDAPIWQPPKVS